MVNLALSLEKLNRVRGYQSRPGGGVITCQIEAFRTCHLATGWGNRKAGVLPQSPRALPIARPSLSTQSNVLSSSRARLSSEMVGAVYPSLVQCQGLVEALKAENEIPVPAKTRYSIPQTWLPAVTPTIWGDRNSANQQSFPMAKQRVSTVQ